MCLECKTIIVGTTGMRYHAQSDATGSFLSNWNDKMSLCCTLWPAVGSIEQENRIQHPGAKILKHEVTWVAILTEVRCSP